MKHGGPAFPAIEMMNSVYGKRPVMVGGMSLRDYFAAAALQGLIATRTYGEGAVGSTYWIVTVQMAYACADAMIAEREKS